MKAADIQITILSDASELKEVLSEAAAYADRFPEAVAELLAVKPARLFRIDSAVVAPAVIVTVWKPSQYLLGFVAALRLCAHGRS